MWASLLRVDQLKSETERQQAVAYGKKVARLIEARLRNCRPATSAVHYDPASERFIYGFQWYDGEGREQLTMVGIKRSVVLQPSASMTPALFAKLIVERRTVSQHAELPYSVW